MAICLFYHRKIPFLNMLIRLSGTGSNKNSLSEGDAELGQTIPAVLIPNGMNFWTPQTESTEQKSQSPYYYTSSKLQGLEILIGL